MYCHKMTLRHLLAAFSLLLHLGELINGSPHLSLSVQLIPFHLSLSLIIAAATTAGAVISTITAFAFAFTLSHRNCHLYCFS